MIEVENYYQDKPVVVIEALLDKVTKIDVIIRNLLESLTKTKCDINGASNNNNVIKKYKNNNDNKEDTVFEGSSLDCRAVTDNRIQQKSEHQLAKMYSVAMIVD
ncbi:7358_t:CDS:2 [Dentiscutata heterogama]|uniref:7358_t:CDS:1 n=1 Tax=Dentiscutata heterogama TaxID=1316150 RepID=A0ACA9KIE7_9GLOM|nr:7358_t:CDS:2 [Dentiscutata heterogama]